MASSINPSNIDGTYPVAGQDNDSQGFRDNFTNTKTNFTEAKSEIEALQTGSVSLSTVNDFNFTGTISEALMKNNADVVNALGTLTAVAMDHATAIIHTATLSNDGIVSFTNWPASGKGGRMRLIVEITSVAHDLTLPATVTLGVAAIQGISGLVITFPTAAPTTYIYDFSTVDGGSNILIEDKTQSALGDITAVQGGTGITVTNGTGPIPSVAVDASQTQITALGTIGSLVATTADINAGTFDGIVGGTTPADGSFTTLSASGALTGTLGTAAQGNITSLGTLTTLTVDTLNLNANSISATNTNGNIFLTPNGTGTVALGGTTATISTSTTNQDLKLNPNGTGTVDFGVPVQTTVGSAGGASAVPAAPTTYMKIEVGGTAYVIPCFAVS